MNKASPWANFYLITCGLRSGIKGTTGTFRTIHRFNSQAVPKMLRQFSVVLLFLVATAMAAYPKARVVYVDPEAYSFEMKCCMGAFNTPTTFNGRYQINAFVVSSHVRNYTSGLQGEFQAQINLTVTTGWGVEEKEVARGAFRGLVGSTRLVDVAMASPDGGPLVVEPDQVYVIYVWYGGDLTYPAFNNYDLSVGPIVSTQTLFTMGVDYEAAP